MMLEEYTPLYILFSITAHFYLLIQGLVSPVSPVMYHFWFVKCQTLQVTSPNWNRSQLLTHICIPVVFYDFSQLKMAGHNSHLIKTHTRTHIQPFWIQSYDKWTKLFTISLVMTVCSVMGAFTKALFFCTCTSNGQILKSSGNQTYRSHSPDAREMDDLHWNKQTH